MTRTRIESLLASFPKLIPTNIQHTSVETAEVRYVYQPLEDLYIVLITNKSSNILQDIDTLHLFARVVSDLCRSADEKEILKHAFELLGAFDEIVSMGYRENVNLMQVRGVLEMESHEEKIQDIIARVRAIFSFMSFRDLVTESLIHRIKRQKLKKNSNVEPSNLRCNVGNNKNVLQQVWGEEAVTAEAESLVILQSPVLKPQISPLLLLHVVRKLRHPLPRGHPLLKAVV